MIFIQKKRQPEETWQRTRKRILDYNQSTYQNKAKTKKPSAQLNQIISGKLGSHKSENLRTLRGRCLPLVNDHKHRKMIMKALKNGILCPDWRALLCE